MRFPKRALQQDMNLGLILQHFVQQQQHAAAFAAAAAL